MIFKYTYLNMCTYVFICMCVHVHMDTHTYMCVYTYTYACIHAHACTHTPTYKFYLSFIKLKSTDINWTVTARIIEAAVYFALLNQHLIWKFVPTPKVERIPKSLREECLHQLLNIAQLVRHHYYVGKRTVFNGNGFFENLENLSFSLTE